MPVPRADIDRALDDITRPFLQYLTRLHAELGGRTEIRIIQNKGGWVALIGPEDVDALVGALRPVADRPREVVPRHDHPRTGEANIYFTLGAVRPDHEGAAGLPLRRRSAAKDTDIVASPWVVVDVDPVREPSSRSATDEEKAAARDVAEGLIAVFAQHEVPTVLADSGNGWHLLARAVPAVGPDAVRARAAACKRLLQGLDERYSTPAAKVDRAVFNPSRLFKLYGTVAVKGPDTPEAPHRLSGIDPAAIPEEVDVLGQLAKLSEPTPKTTPTRSRPSPRSSSHTPTDAPEWRAWRAEALARLDLHAVYGQWLTEKVCGTGWLECRDPASPSGDQQPSAGVADGKGQAERGTFHRFRGDGATMSVFDFLVERGSAPDFPAAQRLVASLSGVPLPARRSSSIDLDAFSDRWAKARDDQERDQLLAGAMRQVVDLPTVQREASLQVLSEVTELPPRALRSAFTDATKSARHEQRSLPVPPTAHPQRPTVEHTVNADTLDTLASKILNIIVPTRCFFQVEHGAVYLERGRGPVPLDEKNLPGLLLAHMEYAVIREGRDGPTLKGYEALPQQLARALLNNPTFRERLPRLAAYVRSPIFDADWNLVASVGWHEPSGLYYDGPEVEVRGGDLALRSAIDGFCWKDEVDRVNFVGTLLTMLTITHWSHGHPFLAINGNRPGAGKSTLARVLSAIVEGQTPHTVSYSANDEEFEKRIATCVEAGSRVIIVDNAKATTAISSPVLERCITDTKLSFRRLGSNTAISRPQNDVLFVLTMNMTQLGQDLRRRALPINLELEGDVRDARYVSDDPVHDALSARVAVLGELAGMIRAWVEAGRPMPKDAARHSTSQKWAATIDAILRHAGLLGFLSNFSASEHAFDPEFEVVQDIAAEHHDLESCTAEDWASVLSNGNLVEKLRDHRGTLKSIRSRATIVGRLFSSYANTTFETPAGRFVLVQHTPRKGHKSVYGFEAAL